MSLLLALSALAAPPQLHHQGRLFDATGLPLAGSHDLTVTLYDTAGLQVWQDTITTNVDQGYFAIDLGTVTKPVEASLIGDALEIGIAVDGGMELPRQSVLSVPWALKADVARDVSGGVVDATEIRIDGNVVIDDSGSFVGTGGGGDGDTLGALTCTAGQIAVFDGSDWGCAAGPGGSVDWNDLVNVPPDVANGDEDTLRDLICAEGQVVKMQSGSWLCGDDEDQVLDEAAVEAFVENGPLALAAGTTVGGAAAVTSWTNLPDIPGDIADGDADTIVTWGTLSGIPSDIADGDDDTIYTDGDAVSALATADVYVPKTGDTTVVGELGATRLRAGEGVVVGADSGACASAGDVGTLSFDGTELSLCTATGWEVVWPPVQLVGSEDNPASSCQQVLTDRGPVPSGLYWLDFSGAKSQYWCDMTTDGGGWTLCAQLDVATASNAQKMAYPTQVSGSYDVGGSFVSDCSSLSFGELLFTESFDGTGDEYIVDLQGNVTPAGFYDASQYNWEINVQGRYVSGAFNTFAAKEMMWTGDRACPQGWNGGLGFRLSVGSVGAGWAGGQSGCYAHQGNYCQNPTVDIGGHVNGQASPDWAIGGDWSTCQYDGNERRLRGTQSRMFAR